MDISDLPPVTQCPIPLKPAVHQVAGHQATDGKLGPLVDNSGLFYKPLQDKSRGATELSFYQSLRFLPTHIRRFFPEFHGVKTLPASDGSGLLDHLVIEDLISPFPHPSLIDIKIGCRTWSPESPESYVEKSLEKDRTSSSLKLGFRISGLQVYLGGNLGFWKPNKLWVKGLTSADQVTSVLKKFVSSNMDTGDCKFAKAVFEVILGDLMELKEWFEEQTRFHFYTSSLLICYDRDEEGKVVKVMVKMIDFAHVVDGEGVIDHNFLGGLCSLIQFLKHLLKEREAMAESLGF